MSSLLFVKRFSFVYVCVRPLSCSLCCLWSRVFNVWSIAIHRRKTLTQKFAKFEWIEDPKRGTKKIVPTRHRINFLFLLILCPLTPSLCCASWHNFSEKKIADIALHRCYAAASAEKMLVGDSTTRRRKKKIPATHTHIHNCVHAQTFLLLKRQQARKSFSLFLAEMLSSSSVGTESSSKVIRTSDYGD